MRVITIWQPYATLLAIQAKKHETRSWYTSYRGPIAIHASVKWDKSLAEAFIKSSELLVEHDWTPDPLLAEIGAMKMGDTLGKILAVGRLNDCVPADLPETFGTIDRELGLFGPGRWAWRISDMRLVKPLAIRGQLGLWSLPPEITLE
jgi:hypothetical protein